MNDYIILLIILVIIIVITFIVKDTNKVCNKEEENSFNKIMAIDLEVQRILDMDGYQFEVYCSKLLELIGFIECIVTQKSRDGGKDIVCKDKENNLIYVECKHFTKNKVNTEQVLKLVGASSLAGAKKSIFITTSEYNAAAAKLANENLILWDLQDIKNILRYILDNKK